MSWNFVVVVFFLLSFSSMFHTTPFAFVVECNFHAINAHTIFITESNKQSGTNKDTEPNTKLKFGRAAENSSKLSSTNKQTKYWVSLIVFVHNFYFFCSVLCIWLFDSFRSIQIQQTKKKKKKKDDKVLGERNTPKKMQLIINPMHFLRAILQNGPQ